MKLLLSYFFSVAQAAVPARRKEIFGSTAFARRWGPHGSLSLTGHPFSPSASAAQSSGFVHYAG